MAEEARGDQDLMAFYNLLRLYERLGKPGNYYKQLSDTSFASHQWRRGVGCGLGELMVDAGRHAVDTSPPSREEMSKLRMLPGKVALAEADLGPVVDTSALGEAAVQTLAANPEKDRRSKERSHDEKKPKKAKKEKRDKGEKRKRSEERP